MSGIASYDVQFRVGLGGAWFDWPGLIGTTQTTATFGPSDPVAVVEGQTYYFRVRALDNAGNQGSYAPNGDCSTTVSAEQYEVYLPVVVRLRWIRVLAGGFAVRQYPDPLLSASPRRLTH